MANLSKPSWLSTLRQQHPDIADRAQRKLEEIIREKREAQRVDERGKAA